MIIFPPLILEKKGKLEFLYCAQEKLRLEHNEMGKKFREKKITEKQWKNYLKIFGSKNYELSCEIAPIRDEVIKKELNLDKLFSLDMAEMGEISNKIIQKKQEFKQSTKWKVDLNNLCQ